jgi:hypothetical protein
MFVEKAAIFLVCATLLARLVGSQDLIKVTLAVLLVLAAKFLARIMWKETLRSLRR